MTDWLSTLRRTRHAAFHTWIERLSSSPLEPETWEALEAALLQADLGVSMTQEVLADLRQEAEKQRVDQPRDLLPLLRLQLLSRVHGPPAPQLPPPPGIMLLVGVNGSGKTTTCAKLANLWLLRGKQVLLAGADTFRAAASDQLQVWANRLAIPMVSGPPGSDPGSVVFSASEAAIRRQMDILLIDTSGRMHTSHNLMDEMAKMSRVAGKVVPGAPHEVYLVLDATTGQNGLQQASAFAARVGVTALIVAKLDQSAKGGAALAASHSLRLPIAYVGTGEGIDDLSEFDAQSFVEALLPSGSTIGGDAV